MSTLKNKKKVPPCTLRKEKLTVNIMEKLDLYIVDKLQSLEETMHVIDRNTMGFAVVCDGRNFLGIVTDGDIRRYLLSGGNLKQKIYNVANQHPLYVDVTNQSKAIPLMQHYGFAAIPVINEKNELVNIIMNKPKPMEHIKENLNVPLVIMAGGKGTRLQPYTDILPKPLIPIDGITITEQIMNRFSAYGCNDVYIIVNYMKDFIKAYFKEKEVSQTIHFIDEEHFLGTGGGLKYVKGKIKETFFVSNCDVLITCNYADLLSWHKNKGNILTIVCAKKNLIIPYGTIEINDEQLLLSMKEKPEVNYNINTGVYIIEPEFLDLITNNESIHMTQLIELAMKNKNQIGAYVINEEHWMDMGQMEELSQMKEKLEYF